MATQPRATIEQKLGQMTPLWDDLCNRAGLTRTGGQLHDLETDAQRFASELVATFRGDSARRDGVPPLHIDKNGGCWW